MASHSSPHLTEKGLWAISIGFVLSKGKRTQKKHWLGRDREIAVKKTKALYIAWENETTVDGDGKKVWDQENIEAALAFAEPKQAPAIQTRATPPQTPNAAPISVPVFAPERYVPPSAFATVYTFPEALEEFKAASSKRTDCGKDHLQDVADQLDCFCARSDEITLTVKGRLLRLTDVTMADLDMEWLMSIRNYIIGRPPTRTKAAKPISINTVTHWLMHLSTAFKWFARTKRIGWVAPDPDWREAFEFNKQQRWAALTPEERDLDDKPKVCFTVDELVKIHKNGTPLERKYLLMGLLLGWTQRDICCFRKDNFIRRGDEFYIERPRTKSSIEGKWWVAPELAAILEKSIAHTPPNKNGYAFTNDDGDYLNAKTDTIRLTWDRALSHAPTGIRNLPFSRIKKRGAQLVQDISGSHELAQLFMAQSIKTVGRKHYAGADPITNDVAIDLGKAPFERLHDTQREIWKRLKPLFFPAKVVKQSQRQEVAA